MAERGSTESSALSRTQVGERIISYVDAGVEALREEMCCDETVIYLGQGIGPRGGNFCQTKGLWKEFGDERVRDTPISELGVTGLGIGAAMTGSRPIVDHVFLDMILEAMGQVVQQAATVHYTSNGKIKLPLVIRGAMGSVRNSGPHHSHCFYAWFIHTPGLKVVVPSNPYDCKGLLKTAIRDDGPVMFIEHKALYNMKGHVPTEEYAIPFGEARICLCGTDVTLVAVSRMVGLALEAASLLKGEGISVEVLDPRTVAPLDRAAILLSVAKTGRLAVVDEAYAECGFAAEVSALVCEQALGDLNAPVRRICALPAPHPVSPPLENRLLPSVERIVRDVKSMLKA